MNKMEMDIFAKNLNNLVKNVSDLVDTMTGFLEVLDCENDEKKFNDIVNGCCDSDGDSEPIKYDLFKVPFPTESVDLKRWAAWFTKNYYTTFGYERILEYCRDKKYLCTSEKYLNKPKEKLIDRGFMDYMTIDYEHYVPCLTPKGQEWLEKKLTDYLQENNWFEPEDEE